MRELLTEEIYKDSSLINFHNAHKVRIEHKDKIKRSDYLKVVDSISTKLYLLLEVSDNNVQMENPAVSDTSKVSHIIVNPEKKQKKPEWFWHLLFGLIGFLIGSSLTFIFRKKQGKIQPKQTIVSFDFEGMNHESSSQVLLNKEREIQQLKEKISLYENQFASDRETEERALMMSQQQPESYGSSESDKVLFRQPDYAPLYFPNPTSDGFFPTNNGRSSFIEGASIFKFNLASLNEATFEYCDDPSSIKIALNNRNELILSVAEELSAYIPSANKIVTEVPGKASLEGEVWKVTQKAKIKYI